MIKRRTRLNKYKSQKKHKGLMWISWKASKLTNQIKKIVKKENSQTILAALVLQAREILESHLKTFLTINFFTINNNSNNNHLKLRRNVNNNRIIFLILITNQTQHLMFKTRLSSLFFH